MKKRVKARARRKASSKADSSSLVSDEDLTWADKYLDSHGLDRSEIPNEGDILDSLRQLPVTQAEIDIDAAVCVLGRFIEAHEKDAVDSLMTQAYADRKKRPYSVKTPFGVLLLARFPQYKPSKASKMGMYIRAGLHKGWSLGKLRAEMTKEWRLERGYKEARDHLEEQGEIPKRQRKTHQPAGALLTASQGSSTSTAAPVRSNVREVRTAPEAEHADDNMRLDEADDDLDGPDESEAPYLWVKVPRPTEAARLPNGKWAYEYDWKESKLFPCRWLTTADVQKIAAMGDRNRAKPISYRQLRRNLERVGRQVNKARRARG